MPNDSIVGYITRGRGVTIHRRDCPNILRLKSEDRERLIEVEWGDGADQTYAFESMMQDGKALQLCTSHLLAESFPKEFGVKFQDKDGSLKTPWCTSWGWTTRSIGARR